MSVDKPDGCLFCELEGEGDDAKNMIIERASRWYVIINKYPYTTGHIMVVCNRHVEGFSDLDDEENAEMTRMMARSERALDNAYKPHGINVGVNMSRSAGAGIVGHLHIHLVPRWHGDTNFMTSVGGTRVISEDLRDSFKRLKKAFELL
jgi:ATP adenylyltransferase